MVSETTHHLAAIMFADIAGYTAMMQQNEAEGMARAERFRGAMQTLVEKHHGELLEIRGDGSLSTFGSAVDAVRCGWEIQEQLRNFVPLRIGIHLGDIVQKKDHIFGDAVNIASRIESMGIPGSVLLSSSVRNQIKNKPEFALEKLGRFAFKNVEAPMSVYALCNEGLAVPKPEEMQGKGERTQPTVTPKTTSSAQSRFRFASIGFVAMMIGALLFWIYGSRQVQGNQATDETLIRQSIAVLPFRDMSEKGNQEYFADGIAEEILNSLSQLKKLKVAGRTSSFSFKGKDVTIAEIGEALHVDHVLDGSIRKDGDVIRISAQLIKVEDGFQVWSHKYDRDFVDIFKIQDDVAQSIGEALFKTLAPEQLAQLNQNENHNSEAYQLSLRAKHIHDNFYKAAGSIDYFLSAKKMLQRAISLDSTYALPHAELSNLYDTRHYYLNDPEEQKQYERLSIKEIDIAYQLDPDNWYINAVRGWIFVTANDLDAAYQSFKRANYLNPNAADPVTGLGYTYWMQGLLEDAIALFKKANDLDPLDTQMHIFKGSSLEDLGRYELARQAYLDAVEINPGHLNGLTGVARSLVFMGRTKEAKPLYKEIMLIDPTFLNLNTYNRMVYSSLYKDEKEVSETEPWYSNYAFLTQNQKGLEKSVQRFFQNPAAEDKHHRTCYYQRMQQNPMYKSLRDQVWFQGFVKEEKVKFDSLNARYPRAVEIINR